MPPVRLALNRVMTVSSVYDNMFLFLSFYFSFSFSFFFFFCPPLTSLSGDILLPCVCARKGKNETISVLLGIHSPAEEEEEEEEEEKSRGNCCVYPLLLLFCFGFPQRTSK